MSARDEWPPITEPKLLERLALDDAGFVAFTEKIAGLFGPREFSDDALEHALAYPWERPPQSYLLRGEATTPAAGISADEQAALATGGARGPARFPLLAFGSNAAPHKLAAKLDRLTGEHRDAFVVSGELHDFDVGVSAHAAIYGAFPATIFPSPGTAVRSAVIWVTVEQLTALAWSEMSYHLGRLDGVSFVPDIEAPPIDSVLLFVSRLGAQRFDGEIAAMAAVAASGRTAAALTQQELLDRRAGELLGAGATASDLVQRLFEDYAGASKLVREALSADALEFESANWTRFGG